MHVGASNEEYEGDPSRSSPSPSLENSLLCTFHVTQRFGLTGPSTHGDPFHTRPKPTFSSLILRRLLRYVNASLETDLRPKGLFTGRSCELSVVLEPGDPNTFHATTPITPEDAAYLGYPDMRIAQEPSLEQLALFAESLRGKKATLHASSRGSFAQHLTSYLTAWGMDVSHVSTEPDVDEGESIEGFEFSLTGPSDSGNGFGVPNILDGSPVLPSATSTLKPSDLMSFVLIDDDVTVLRNLLQKIKTESPYPLHLHSRKRPSLASNHRPRSSPLVTRVMGGAPSVPQSPPTQVIVHFTSLSNYKQVKDAIQSTLTPPHAPFRMPEVIVIPKPAGPRRFLTALHTAVTKPIVDPYFVPIATSPISPGLHAMSPVFQTNQPRSPNGRSSLSVRTSSDRSTRSPREHVTDPSSSILPPSPLGGSEAKEYFPESMVKLGSSPSTGLVIQSPDGQPAGIFFHPKARGLGNPGLSPAMRRDTPHDTPRQRGTSFRTPSSSSAKEDEGMTREPMSIAASIAGLTRHLPTITPDGDSPTSAPSKGKGRAPIEEPVLITQPVEELGSMEPPPKSAPRTVARRSSQTSQASASPPLSPQVRAAGGPTSSLRRQARRPSGESSHPGPSATAISQQKKGKLTGDTNIVPPISVLIVDGE